MDAGPILWVHLRDRNVARNRLAALLPGHGPASTPSLVVQARARLLLLSRLLRLDPDGPRWPSPAPEAAPVPAPAAITALGEAGRAAGHRRRGRSAARHEGSYGRPG